jgi:hypothetical protein
MSDKMGGLPRAVAANSDAAAPHSATLSGAEATQGIKLGHMRYVLGTGLALAVIAGVIVITFFAH